MNNSVLYTSLLSPRVGSCVKLTPMRDLMNVSSEGLTLNKGVKMAEKEKYIKMTEAEVKELTTSAYKEGLARGQPIEDTSGTIEDAKEIQKKTFAELLGLTGLDNEGSVK